ncbi:MAG: hypothetical protein GY855_01315 [candidate division Zixibacteria bacterium]|nr:hypothetical protein [candidate division Zixibacteria bacterium]
MLVKEELELLLELQNIDDQLGELDRSKVYLPDMISNIENDVSNAKERYQEAQEEFENLTREKKHLELEIEVAQDELNKSQVRMETIKTNKEYDALTAQISTSKQKISEMEEKLLEIMEGLDKTKEEIEEFKKKSAELEESNKDVLKNLKKEIDSIEDKIRIKGDQRTNVAVRINRRTISHYDRIRRGKGGMAVVTVRKRSCGGCFKQLPPQMVQEIKKGEKLLTCDNCGRILLWAGDDSQ